MLADDPRVYQRLAYFGRRPSRMSPSEQAGSRPECRVVAGQRPSSLTDADLHASVCSAISKASSTSTPLLEEPARLQEDGLWARSSSSSGSLCSRRPARSGPSTKNSPNEKGTDQPIADRPQNATKRNNMSPDMTPTECDSLYSLNRTRRGLCRSLPPVSIRHRSSGRPAAGNDDGFAERSPIFLLADRIHRPQLRQQLVDQRTQPRPRRAVRE